jgi:hypothetical protein
MRSISPAIAEFNAAEKIAESKSAKPTVDFQDFDENDFFDAIRASLEAILAEKRKKRKGSRG